MIMYKISLTNWHEHNPQKKKSHKKTMIANNLISDAKVLALTMSQRWLFINLLLIAGDYANDTVTLTERQVNEILTTKEGANNALLRLQQLQLVSVEKIETFRKELRVTERSEKKGIITEVLGRSKNADEKKINADFKIIATEQKDQNRKIKNEYINAYRLRYGIDPATTSAKFNSTISNLRKQFGVEESVAIVKFYLTHNDSFYLKNTHSINICLSQADTLRTQMLRGKPITNLTIKKFEKQQQNFDRNTEIENLWKDEKDVNQ